jgi:hypothetical protein
MRHTDMQKMSNGFYTESVAMNLKYLEAIKTASTLLAEAILSDMEEALSYGAGLDRSVQELTHAIGQDTLTLVYSRIWLGSKAGNSFVVIGVG